MTITLVLDGVPFPISGGDYPAGLGVPRQGDHVIVGAGRYEVTLVVWPFTPLDHPAITSVEVHGRRIGAAS